mgnify:CR=1 FL=1
MMMLGSSWIALRHPLTYSADFGRFTSSPSIWRTITEPISATSSSFA